MSIDDVIKGKWDKLERVKKSNKVDAINAPEHYRKGSVECLDYIKQQLGSEFPAYLEASAIKYLHRHKFKNSNIQDLEKCVFFVNKLIDHYKSL